MLSSSPKGREETQLEHGIWDLDEIEERVVKPNQWGAVGARTFKAFSVTHQKLPQGCYSISKDMSDDRIIFVGKYIKSDKIMRFKGGMTDHILKEIDDFWKKEQKFIDNGFLHRRGYLLYGSQGTGKSSIVWQVAQDVIQRGGVVFVCDNPKFFAEGLKIFRNVEPGRPIVCVFEDIDAIIRKYGEPDILSLLDGDNQVDRVLNIATTNYPEMLDKRIVNRPRRFDRIHKILSPDDSVRIAFLKEKLPKEQDLKLWIKKTKGLSFAALAESLISVLCLGNELDDTVKILRDIESKNPKSSDFGTGIGFDDDDEDGDEDGGSPPSSARQIKKYKLPRN